MLTAAHCVPWHQSLEQLRVVTGDQVWDLGEQGETRHRVCGVTRHPAYREESVGDRVNWKYVGHFCGGNINKHQYTFLLFAPKYQELLTNWTWTFLFCL